MTPDQDSGADSAVVGPSDRSFGLVFAAVFAAVAVLPLGRGAGIRVWALALSLIFVALAVARPGMLAPANHVWFRFGLALHRVMHPIVMGVLFYVVVTPFALVTRLLKPGLARRFRANQQAASHWIERTEPWSPMDRQF